MDFERRVWGQFVTKVFKGVVGTPLEQSLLRAGLDVTSTSADVPVEHFSRWLGLYSSELHPDVSRGEAMRRVGFDLVFKKYEGYSLSEAMTTLPQRLQQHVGEFLDVSMHEVAPYRYVAHFDDVGSLHTFFLGMFEGATSSTGVPSRVVWRPEGLSGARYEVRSSPVPGQEGALSRRATPVALEAEPHVAQ